MIDAELFVKLLELKNEIIASNERAKRDIDECIRRMDEIMRSLLDLTASRLVMPEQDQHDD